MASFTQYLREEMEKSQEESTRDTPIRPGEDVFTELENADPAVWTARVVGGRKYLFYTGKFLDVTALAGEIRSLYSARGYEGYGFAKLDESELIRYARSKSVLARSFSSCAGDELDPAGVAESMFASEMKDFDWKPEEY